MARLRQITPKWLGEGAKGLLGQGSKSLKKGSARPKPCFAPVQPSISQVQKGFGARLHPKAFGTLSQPLWGDFPESGDLPGPQLPNSNVFFPCYPGALCNLIFILVRSSK